MNWVLRCIHLHHENWFVQRFIVFLSSFFYLGLDFLWTTRVFLGKQRTLRHLHYIYLTTSYHDKDFTDSVYASPKSVNISPMLSSLYQFYQNELGECPSSESTAKFVAFFLIHSKNKFTDYDKQFLHSEGGQWICYPF